MDDLVIFESSKGFAECLEAFRVWRLQGYTVRGTALEMGFLSGRKRVVAEEYKNVTQEKYFLLVWYVDDGPPDDGPPEG